MTSTNLKKMRFISIIWGSILCLIFLGLTSFGIFYKSQTKQYRDFENILKEKTKGYIENHALLPEDKIKITLDELIENKVIETSVINDKKCSGYVIIENKKGKYFYLPFIKCGNYKTKVYENQ